MKRLRPSFTIALATLLLCSGCYTSRTGIGGDPEATLAGATIGGNVGGLMGGLIGESHHGWHGGYRGSAIGAIVGTLAGAAIGHAVSRNRNEQEDVYVIERTEPARVEPIHHSSTGLENLRIRNIRFIDDDRDHTLRSGESSKIIFDIINESNRPVFNVVPVVEELTGMKRIYLSPSVMVESIGPHNGIKYTATLTAGKRIKTGEIVLRVSVADSFGQPYDGQEFSLPTLR